MEPGAVGSSPADAKASTVQAVAEHLSPNTHYVRLVLVLVFSVVTSVTLRNAYVPDDFGRNGHYRAAAVGEIVAEQPLYMGSGTCVECHETQTSVLPEGAHQLLSCEVCHGPGGGHLTMTDARLPMDVRLDSDACLACHLRVVGRPESHTQVALAEHARDVEFVPSEDTCADCHDPHEP